MKLACTLEKPLDDETGAAVIDLSRVIYATECADGTTRCWYGGRNAYCISITMPFEEFRKMWQAEKQ